MTFVHLNLIKNLCVVTLLSLSLCLFRYIAFDFHKECSRMRWHRLQILVDMVAEMQDEFGYVWKELNGPGNMIININYFVFCQVSA